MSQKANPHPIKYKCPNGISYSPEKNIEQYQFQLKYSPLINHNVKNPGSLCYINENTNTSESFKKYGDQKSKSSQSYAKDDCADVFNIKW